MKERTVHFQNQKKNLNLGVEFAMRLHHYSTHKEKTEL